MKKTVIPDIYNLGYSLVHKQITKDLEKVFAEVVQGAGVSDPAPDTDATNLANPSELAELIKTVAGLTRKVASIESEIQSLRQENAVLRAQHGTNRHAPVVPDSVVVQQSTSQQHSAPGEDADGSSCPNSERDTSDIDVFQLPPKYQWWYLAL